MRSADCNGKANLVNGVNSDSGAGKPRIEFGDLLVDSVDEVFNETLGAKITAMFWQHWSTSLGVTRENMPNHLPQVLESIQEVFGTGYRTMGEQLIRRLYAKANTPLKFSNNQELLEYAEELRQILARDPEHI